MWILVEVENIEDVGVNEIYRYLCHNIDCKDRTFSQYDIKCNAVAVHPAKP